MVINGKEQVAFSEKKRDIKNWETNMFKTTYMLLKTGWVVSWVYSEFFR